jgi:predicted transcriptional regulator of viral defense system
MKNKKYKMISKKLLLIAGVEHKKLITRDEIKKYCKTFNASYYSMINYLLNNGYLTRILRGIFYINNLEERKRKLPDISFYNAISEALRLKGVKNWYFGLETAIKFNNLTHEYFAIDFIISDKLKRPKPINILGHKVHFLKIKKELAGFGIKKENIPYSDTEKTIMDIIYFGIYNGLLENEISNKIIDYLGKCNKNKLADYSRHYPKTLLRFIEAKI